jgi:hypothetical protein
LVGLHKRLPSIPWSHEIHASHNTSSFCKVINRVSYTALDPSREQRCPQSRQLARKAIGASVLANNQGNWVSQSSKGEVGALFGSLVSLV